MSMSTPTKHEDSTDTEPVDPWGELRRLVSVFRYRGEATGDPELQDVAVALDGLTTPESRQAIIKAAKRELKLWGVALNIRRQADALVGDVAKARQRSDDPRRVAASIVTDVIKYQLLQRRARRWPNFTDTPDAHEAAIDAVAKAIAGKGDPERIVIAAMGALGDERAENLFGGRRK